MDMLKNLKMQMICKFLSRVGNFMRKSAIYHSPTVVLVSKLISVAAKNNAIVHGEQHKDTKFIFFPNLKQIHKRTRP